jgi:hypothetical protein
VRLWTSVTRLTGEPIEIAERAVRCPPLRAVQLCFLFARELECLAGLEDANRGAEMVRLEMLNQAIDRVVRSRRDVMKRPPVIRNEHAPAQTLEQC